uniref:Ig-like domain-containing protein n=1 Tax=Anser cygnoides TaxID=8845 RepID=A0A8B9D795_ANSCY
MALPGRIPALSRGGWGAQPPYEVLTRVLAASGASVPTLAPPLTMVVDGQHRQLVVCVVSDVPPGSGDAVWISSGNGSALQSFTYGASPEDGGTVCAVSILPESPPEGGLLACHVGPNSTAPARSSSPVPVAGMVSPLPGSVGTGPTEAPVMVGSRCEVPRANVAPRSGCRKGFVAGPDVHLPPPPQLLSILQAAARRQSCAPAPRSVSARPLRRPENTPPGGKPRWEAGGRGGDGP